MQVTKQFQRNGVMTLGTGQIYAYQVLKNEEELIILSYDLLQLHNTWMIQFAQRLHFS